MTKLYLLASYGEKVNALTFSWKMKICLWYLTCDFDYSCFMNRVTSYIDVCWLQPHMLLHCKCSIHCTSVLLSNKLLSLFTSLFLCPFPRFSCELCTSWCLMHWYPWQPKAPYKTEWILTFISSLSRDLKQV